MPKRIRDVANTATILGSFVLELYYEVDRDSNYLPFPYNIAGRQAMAVNVGRTRERNVYTDM